MNRNNIKSTIAATEAEQMKNAVYRIPKLGTASRISIVKSVNFHFNHGCGSGYGKTGSGALYLKRSEIFKVYKTF